MRLPATLERLSLINVSAPPRLNPELTWPPSLRSLVVNECGAISQKGLTKLTNLTVLDMRDRRKPFQPFSTTLRRLGIGDAIYPGEATSLKLRPVPNVRELAVRGNWRPRPSSLHLRHLTLDVCDTSGVWADMLPLMTGLTSLELLEYRAEETYDPPQFPESLLELDITATTHLDKLYWLEADLSVCTRLLRLDLEGLWVTQNSLLLPPSLRRLAMLECDLSGQPLSCLPREMDSVYLRHCSVSGALGLPDMPHAHVHVHPSVN